MNIDFPLILVIVVLGSGAIWLLDRLLLARGRAARRLELAEQFPGHQEVGSKAAISFAEACHREASEPVVVEYARSFFPVLAVVLVLRSFLYEPFQIPSSSMVPTLEVGDYILVNKFSYGLRLPVTRTKVLDVGAPERGDVMVFFRAPRTAQGEGSDDEEVGQVAAHWAPIVAPNVRASPPIFFSFFKWLDRACRGLQGSAELCRPLQAGSARSELCKAVQSSAEL